MDIEILQQDVSTSYQIKGADAALIQNGCELRRAEVR